MFIKQTRLLALAAAMLAAVVGCAHLATPEEKEISYRRFQSISVNGIRLGEFLQQRTALVIAGAEVSLVSSNEQVANVRLRAAASDGFDVGSAAAVAEDGYFLTAAHCVRRTPLFLVLPDGAQVKIVAARLVWLPPPDSANDIALLKARTGWQPAFELAGDEDIGPGMDVVTAGANGLAGGKILGRWLAAPEPAGDGPDVWNIAHDAPLAEGDSGGPLATTDGRLIGIEAMARGQIGGGAQGIALRPNLNWLAGAIAKDRWAHSPTTAAATTRPSVEN